jgi:multidrug efflux system outer membrane protein
LARSTFDAQQGAYRLIERRYEEKLANEIDLQRAQTQADTARGDIARYTGREAQARNALNLLAGAPVPEDLLPANLLSVLMPQSFSAGLSSEVLLRRPDVASAEHRLKAAYANVGAARAAFFPRISLTTALGSASSDLSDLFSAGTKTWLYGGQATMPIFDARTWFAYRVSKSTRQIALAEYEKSIQTAFREVADVLAVRGTVDGWLEAQRSVVDSASKIYNLSQKRYQNGIDSYLSVLDAQRVLYLSQQGLIALQWAKFDNEVKTYAVLGGGADRFSEPEVSWVRKIFRFFRL